MVEDWTGSAALIVLIYLVIVVLALELITFPIDIYTGHVIERKFNLSRATLGQWLGDWAKGQALQLAFVIAANTRHSRA